MNKFDVPKVVKNKLLSIYKQSKNERFAANGLFKCFMVYVFNVHIIKKKCGEY